MPDGEQPEEPRITVGELTEIPLTVRFWPRTVEFFGLDESELEALVEAQAPVHLTFFGVAAGAFVTLLATILSVDLGDRAFATFVAVAAGAGVLSAYFGIRAFVDRRQASRLVERIKSKPVVERNR